MNEMKVSGVYYISKINKETGKLELVAKKKNRVTPQLFAIIMSGMTKFQRALAPIGLDTGHLNCISGLLRGGVSDNDTYIENSLALYCLKTNVPDTSIIVDFPFMSDNFTVDETEIVAIGEDTTTGAKYAKAIQPQYMTENLNLFSRSWKLEAGKGLGTITTLALGKSNHKEPGISTVIWSGGISTPDYNIPPLVAKVLATQVLASDGLLYKVDGWLPPGIPNITAGDEILIGLKSGTYAGAYYKYKLGTDKLTEIGNTDPLFNVKLTQIGSNAIVSDDNNSYLALDGNDADKYSTVDYSLITERYLYNVTQSDSYPPQLFEHDGRLIGSERAYLGGLYSTALKIYNKSTGALDTTLWLGDSSPTLAELVTGGIIGDLPSWFLIKAIGKNKVNGNWLVLDGYKCRVIECTDLANVQATAVNHYYSATVNNINLGGTMYFVPFEAYTDVLDFKSDVVGTGDSVISINPTTSANMRLQIAKATDSSPMYSIVSDIKDSLGNPIVQEADTEYVFTYAIEANN